MPKLRAAVQNNNQIFETYKSLLDAVHLLALGAKVSLALFERIVCLDVELAQHLDANWGR